MEENPMEENPRFKLVFVKLRDVLEKEAPKEPAEVKIDICATREVSREELDEIDYLRRIVLQVTESEPMSFTTT